MPAIIRFGAPLDPVTREPLDRAHRLQCIVAGEECDPYQHWPMRPIEREEFDRLVAAMGDDVRSPRRLSDEKTLF